MLVGRILHRAADISPGSLAATLGDETVTFGEVHRRANQMARALESLGVGEGQRIASWTGIALGSLDVFFAAARLGAAYAPLNPSLSTAEALNVLTYLRPRVLVTDTVHMEQSLEVAGVLDLTLAVMGAGPRTVPGIDLDRAAGTASARALDRREPTSDSPHVIFLTSGSTGRPKGVVLSHYSSWMRAVPTGGATRLVAPGGGGDLCPFPLFHMAAWNAVLCAWALLRPVHLVTQTDGDNLHAELARWRAATLYCIPALWRRFFDSSTSHDLSSLRYAMTGTSLVSEELLLEIKDRLPGTETTISYGSTEMGIVTTLGDHDLFRKLGSIGRPNPSFDAVIIDGELCLRGETVMSGYFDLPEESDAAFHDGWYRSGDLAEMDDEGYLTIKGRLREIIRSGGETIAPSEVEAAVSGFPGIREVAVVGLPDDVWGEIVCAVLVMDHDVAAPGLAEVRAYLESRLAAFKHPRAVTTVTDLPRTPATGQIQHNRVRASLLAAQGRAGREGDGDRKD
jgi:acyl-CoA synthetase (AMP-forming)/AMP-acid ligase II